MEEGLGFYALEQEASRGCFAEGIWKNSVCILETLWLLIMGSEKAGLKENIAWPGASEWFCFEWRISSSVQFGLTGLLQNYLVKTIISIRADTSILFFFFF